MCVVVFCYGVAAVVVCVYTCVCIHACEYVVYMRCGGGGGGGGGGGVCVIACVCDVFVCA